MPMASTPTSGTGLAGSLTYSSLASFAVGAVVDSVPASSKKYARGAAFGGHVSAVSQRFDPVSKIGHTGDGRRWRTLQQAREEPVLDLGPVVQRRGLPELHLARLRAVAACPSAVRPRPHGEMALRLRALLPQHAERPQRAVQVLGVVPASDDQHRRRHVLEVAPDRAGLPEVVVRGVFVVHHPVRILVEPVLPAHLHQRAAIQVELVAVLRAVLELAVALRTSRLRPARRKLHVEREVVRQQEGAVVVRVVVQVVVGDGRLRRDGLQRGVRIDQRCERVEAGIGDAPHPDSPVVAGDVLHQPVDGVVRVRGFVPFGSALARLVRTDLLPLAFRQVPPTHVLVGHDPRFVGERARRSDRLRIGVGSVGTGAVRRALQQDRRASSRAGPG